MIFYLLAVVLGFALLVWSADRFVDGAASTAKHLGMPSLLIGILIVGFCYYKVGGMVKNLCKQNKNLTFAEINKLQWKRILI